MITLMPSGCGAGCERPRRHELQRHHGRAGRTSGDEAAGGQRGRQQGATGQATRREGEQSGRQAAEV